MTVYAAFGRWVQAEVRLWRDQLRLGGGTSGGSRTAAGRSGRAGVAWKVRADTHLELRLLVCGADRSGSGELRVGRSGEDRTRRGAPTRVARYGHAPPRLRAELNVVASTGACDGSRVHRAIGRVSDARFEGSS